MFPDIQVPMREILLAETKLPDGTIEKNAPVRVYETSGPWGDEDFNGSVESVMPALRAAWVRAQASKRISDPTNDPLNHIRHRPCYIGYLFYINWHC